MYIIQIMLYTYWKGTLISRWLEITDKECLEFGKKLIEKSIRKNINIKDQIHSYTNFMNLIKKRKDNKQSIYQSDHQLAFHSLMALCYLQITELDDDNNGIFRQKSHLLKRKRKLLLNTT